jgi:hypothetical protein
MAGFRQDEARLAAPHPQLPGERSLLIGLTVNLAVNIQQFVHMPSGLPAVQPLKRYARRGHGHLLR